jgi:hypothetical protein
MKNIFDTLLEKLFIAPNPQPDNPEILEVYRGLYNRMYPDDDKFITFLSSQDVGKQYKMATLILEELCLVSNYPPSYWALNDLLVIEDFRKQITIEDRYNRERKNHTIRDHYLHLVYLYLLGIYLYFYNGKIYSGINDINHNARIASSYENKRFISCKDFISEWKYFCLYHDVGYADEILNNKKIASRKIKDPADFKKSIGEEKNISLHHSIFAAVEIMSKVLVADLIVSYSKEKRDLGLDYTIRLIDSFIREESTVLYGSKRKTKASLQFSEKYMKMQKIYSNRILKFILPFLPSNKIMVVVTNRRDGSIALVSVPNVKSRKTYCYRELVNDEEINQYCRNPEILFFDDLCSATYDFSFYIETTFSINNVIRSLFNSVDTGRWKSTLNSLLLKYREGFLATYNEKQLTQFYFQTYKDMFETIINLFASPDNLDIDMNKNTDLVYKALLKKYSDNIKKGYSDELEKAIFRKFKVDDNTFEDIDSIFEFCNSHITDEIKSLNKSNIRIKHITERVKEKFNDKFVKELDLVLIFLNLQQTIHTSFDIAYQNSDWNVVLKRYSLKRFECLYGKKNAVLLLDDFSSQYEYAFKNTSDHGVASAVYAVKVVSMYQELIKQNENAKYIWLNILLDITNKNRSLSQYINNYDHVFSNVISAVFLHNLNVKQFKNPDMQEKRVKPSDTFTYFAMLCDALQHWNRPYAELQYQTRFLTDNASDFYDIETIDGRIYVYEDGEEEFQERLKKNIAKLSENMEDVGSIVKNGYSNRNKK